MTKLPKYVTPESASFKKAVDGFTDLKRAQKNSPSGMRLRAQSVGTRPHPVIRRFFLPLVAFLLLLQHSPAQLADVTPDPAASRGIWEGWGTSLAWWAAVFGNRDDVADLLFTAKTVTLEGQTLPGLDLNIVRYNAGGCSWNEVDGHKIVVSQIYFPRQMEGFWLDGKSADPQSPSWNWSVDANQRAMMAKARDRGPPASSFSPILRCGGCAATTIPRAQPMQ
jgi:hypothetical protein